MAAIIIGHSNSIKVEGGKEDRHFSLMRMNIVRILINKIKEEEEGEVNTDILNIVMDITVNNNMKILLKNICHHFQV
jgi:hypothetical protein